MASFFSDLFRAQLAANQNILNPGKIRLAFFRYAPSLDGVNATWRAARTLTELKAVPGWVEVANIGGYPLTLDLDVSTRTLGASKYVMYTSYNFSAMTESAEVEAIVVLYIGTLGGQTNPIIMVTNSPTGPFTTMHPGDSLTSQPDSSFPDNTNRWLIGWATASPDPVEGQLQISRDAPVFEVSGSQHVWLYPQRANMIANPSFEGNPGYWSGNAAVTRVSGGAPGGGAWAGGVTAPTPGYLNTAVGTVSIPDPGPLPNDCTFVFKVLGPTVSGAATEHTIAAQYGATNRAWKLSRGEATGRLRVVMSVTGTTDTAGKNTPDLAPSGADELLAVAIHNSTTREITLWRSLDAGKTWQNVGVSGSDAAVTMFDSTAVMRIGAHSTTTEPWEGRIYSVELRTGLNPAAGTVLWRFDANDYPGTGTSYVDPRGLTWTLSAAGAIVPKVGDVSTSGYAIMESNLFPTRLGQQDAEQWTVQLMARGVGKLKVGIVYWDPDYRLTQANWGDPTEVWTLSPSAWIHVAVHRHCPQAHLAMVRLEVQGSSLQVDRVLAERGYLKDWLYFDGDDVYGARDDFSWYGGSSRKGNSYSLWYNHRKAVTGRLFAMTVDPNDPSGNVTAEDIEEQGLVYRWVPAGITVVPHMDVFYPHDLQNEVTPKGAGVLPYYSAGTPTGVINPWTL